MQLLDPRITAPTERERRNVFFSSDLCEGQTGEMGAVGEGYWCPGSSASCPCAGATGRRLIVKVAADIDPCPGEAVGGFLNPSGSGSIQACMAHIESQMVFSFDVYNPYINNGQIPPRIMVYLDGHDDVLPTLLKTCAEPTSTLVSSAGVPIIKWNTAKDANGDCIKDATGSCVGVSTDRTDIDRCPSAPYLRTSPMRILPAYQCFTQNIELKTEEKGNLLPDFPTAESFAPYVLCSCVPTVCKI
jgi:hypothetical protein